jgi:hypothetical protein
MHPRGLDFFLLGRWRLSRFFRFLLFPKHRNKVPNVFPNMFTIALHFIPYVLPKDVLLKSIPTWANIGIYMFLSLE